MSKYTGKYADFLKVVLGLLKPYYTQRCSEEEITNGIEDDAYQFVCWVVEILSKDERAVFLEAFIPVCIEHKQIDDGLRILWACPSEECQHCIIALFEVAKTDNDYDSCILAISSISSSEQRNKFVQVLMDEYRNDVKAIKRFFESNYTDNRFLESVLQIQISKGDFGNGYCNIHHILSELTTYEDSPTGRVRSADSRKLSEDEVLTLLSECNKRGGFIPNEKVEHKDWSNSDQAIEICVELLSPPEAMKWLAIIATEGMKTSSNNGDLNESFDFTAHMQIFAMKLTEWLKEVNGVELFQEMFDDEMKEKSK